MRAAGKAPIVQRYHIGGDNRDNPEFPLSNSPKTPLVYHLFGHAHEPDSLVLSENDLLDFLIAIASDRPQLPSSLLRTLKRGPQSFLFIGFGITQWYLRVLLKVLMRTLEFHRTGSKPSPPSRYSACPRSIASRRSCSISAARPSSSKMRKPVRS